MNELLIYETSDKRVSVRLDGETVWLTQRQMSELFETTPENVLMHLRNIFTEEELDEAATAKDFLAVQTEGKRQVQRQIKHYHLFSGRMEHPIINKESSNFNGCDHGSLLAGY